MSSPFRPMRPLQRTALAAALLAASFAVTAQSLAPAPAPSAKSGIDRSGMDPAVRVQDDLFRAVNGGWLAQTPIPADKAEYGTFVQLADQSDRDIKAIVERLARTPQAKASVAEKVANFYKAYTDTAGIDRAGLAPLRPLLAEVERLQTRTDLSRYLGQQQGVLNLPIGLGVMADFKEPSVNRPLTWQGGLGLPDRDYYLKDSDERYAKALKDYRA